MSHITDFNKHITDAYQFKGPSIDLGAAMLDGVAQTGTIIKLPLKTFNRHGLIAGATGTGKTKTIQILAEQLSKKGVPSLIMDVKGDLSGIAAASSGHPKIDERHNQIGFPFVADNSPVEFLSLSDEPGARLRATVTEFGPILLSKILELNNTQSSILSVVFKYADDQRLALLDLKDLQKVLQYVIGEGKDEFQSEYGRVSSASVGTITRKIIELEQQGAEKFFGEESFDVQDLVRRDEDDRGIVSIIRLSDIQDRPKLFSTFMLQIMAEIYSTFPEQGDAEQPELCIFIDEAHLVFNEASDALLDQIESMVKLIRSKGIGLFFITQLPTDIPDNVLSQLGLKVQHALRAFTAKDRKAIKASAQNYPITEYYQVDQLLTNMGIGEAIVTALDEKGRPTPLAHTYLRAPQSRMDVLTDSEIKHIISQSDLIEKYNAVIDRESAYELLTAKIEAAEKKEALVEAKPAKSSSRKSKDDPGILESLSKNTAVRQMGRTVAREVTRGLFSVLGIKTTRRRSTRKKTGWF